MTVGRKAVLSIVVTVVFFVGVEGLLAILGVEPEAYESDPYVGFTSTSRLFVETKADDGSALMKTSDAKLTLFNEQEFPLAKDGAIRIFCVGGSTTFGRPYDDRTSFCGWLRELLPVADPTRRWEVINAGGVSYASYRVALLMEELVDYEPDLFVVYTGHNEFLERRSYAQIIATPKAVRGFGAVVSKTRLWTAMSGALSSVTAGPEKPVSSPDLLSEEVTTLLDNAVGPSAYRRDDELARQILRHFRFNLARMVDIAASVGAETVFVTPASNLRDSRPFKSEHRDDLDDAGKGRFDELVKGAQAARAANDAARALELVERAAAIDPRYAQLAFLEGRLRAEAGDVAGARAAFERARDEDVCPLRAVGPIPDIVRDVAAERGAAVVDFARLADGWARQGIPGADLFLDHVHPTIEVHRRLAVAIIEKLDETGVLRIDPAWGDGAIAEVARRVEGAIDNRTHALALMKLSKVIGWAGKLDEAYRLAMRAVELDPDDSRIQYNAGLTAHLLGRKNQAVAHYRRAVEIQPDADEPHGNLGVLLEEAGMLEQAIEHFRLAIRYARSSETAQRNSANLAHALMLAGYEDYSRGRGEAALAKLSEAAAIAPGDPEIKSRLGVAQLAAGRTGDAVASFENVVVARPEDAADQNRLALALALDGQLDRAARAYARAFALDSSIAERPDDLFRVLARMGRTGLADEVRRRISSQGGP